MTFWGFFFFIVLHQLRKSRSAVSAFLGALCLSYWLTLLHCVVIHPYLIFSSLNFMVSYSCINCWSCLHNWLKLIPNFILFKSEMLMDEFNEVRRSQSQMEIVAHSQGLSTFFFSIPVVYQSTFFLVGFTKWISFGQMLRLWCPSWFTRISTCGGSPVLWQAMNQWISCRVLR